MSEADDRQRLAALEAEAARLRERLAVTDPAAAPPEAKQAGGPDSDEAMFRPPTRAKIVLIGLAVVILSAGLFWVAFTALSKAFDSVARQAAKSYTSTMDNEAPSRPPPPDPPPSPGPPPPRVPGL